MFWSRYAFATSVALIGLCWSQHARAVDIPNVGGKTLNVDISNTTELGYHFNNRNHNTDPNKRTLNPARWVDDNYFEWLNRMYIQARYWKLSFGLRLDSAVYGGTLERDDIQQLIVDELGQGDLSLENRFAREIHSRYTNLIYPSKLWLRFRHPGIEATVGDFYAHVGRGLVFSVRKIDEVGIDTTVRGAKVKLKKKFGKFRLNATVFGGQLNPIRLDFATGRVLHGSGSPLFFGFPSCSADGLVGAGCDFQYYTSPDDARPSIERAKPSYLEDNVVGTSIKFGPKQAQLGLHGALLLRQSNSEENARCIANGTPADDCNADFPTFGSAEASRAHDQIRNFSASLRVPPIKGVFDSYVEVAGQHMTDGQIATIEEDGTVSQAEDLFGYAVYGNVNLSGGPFTATMEGKHYRKFFPLGGNIDFSTLGFAAPEFNVVTYSRPPNTEAIYTEPLGAPDICNTGGRMRLDAQLQQHAKLFGWLGGSVSFSEIDSNNQECLTDDELRTNTWDTAVGTELESKSGRSHYWAWLGARLTDRTVPAISNQAIAEPTEVFYREGYVRYDMTQHLTGPFSLSMLGFHRRRYEPIAFPDPWNEGENLLALNYNPHWSFIFGFEYETREGFEPYYFNGALQYRSKSSKTWYHQMTDAVRLYVGQRRAALRCVGGTCRVYPAFEGAKLELVSRF